MQSYNHRFLNVCQGTDPQLQHKASSEVHELQYRIKKRNMSCQGPNGHVPWFIRRVWVSIAAM